MIFTFHSPLPVTQPQTPSSKLIGGADISLFQGDTQTTDGGDWKIVSGVDAAWQSVVRESLLPKGCMPQRPDYGAGVTTMLLKGQTKAVRDQIVSAIKARLRQNPRIRRVHEVRCDPMPSGSGVVVTVRADAVDGPITGQIPVRSPGR